LNIEKLVEIIPNLNHN